jgi:hypothetical protein
MTPEHLEKLAAMKAHRKHHGFKPHPSRQRLDDFGGNVVLKLSVRSKTVNQYSPVSVHAVSKTAACKRQKQDWPRGSGQSADD